MKSIGNKHAQYWLIDVGSAAIGSLVGYPLLLTCLSGNVFETFFEMRDMAPDQWIAYLCVLSGPAAILGLFAARLFRRRRPNSLTPAALGACVSLLMSAVSMIAVGCLLSIAFP
ncbi:MAG: hypothetical protein WBC44_18240 [Planctomycetaceae bacterium]